jgi:hypothetical protein
MGCSDSIAAGISSPGPDNIKPTIPGIPLSPLDVVPQPQPQPTVAASPLERQVFAVIDNLLCTAGHLTAVREYIAFRTFIMQLPRARFIKSELNHKQAADYSAAILKELCGHPDYTYIHMDTIVLCMITNPNVKNNL